MILVHKHPGGNVYPFDGDIDFTDKMFKVGQPTRLTHRIIYTEFAEVNLLPGYLTL